MPIKVTLPVLGETRTESHTFLILDDLEAIRLELNGLIHRLAKLEAEPAPEPATERTLWSENSARNWEQTAQQNQRNTNYYRGLVVRIGTMLGMPAKTADDGSISLDVLCAKVPELVNRTLTNFAVARAEATVARGEANQYRKLHALLASNRDLVLMRDDAYNVRIKGANFNLICQGSSLSDALDHLETKS